MADTGFAKDTQVEASAGGVSKSRTIYGSDGYMDPAVLNSNDYAGSAISDAYSVGITLLVCLTNRPAGDIFDSCARSNGALECSS